MPNVFWDRAQVGKIDMPFRPTKRTMAEAVIRAAKEKAPGVCWLWHIQLDGKGYGSVNERDNGRRVKRLVHRVSFECFKGPISEGLSVLHSCDVRNCFNPEHLFLGTAHDNTDDMVAKGRHATGPKQPHAKLNNEAVAKILQEYRPRKVSMSKLGAKYGVSEETIRRVILGKSWRHVSA